VRSVSEQAIIASSTGATKLLNARGVLVGPCLMDYEWVGDGGGQFQRSFPPVFWDGRGDPPKKVIS
jgi:hypothetical protein